MSLRDDLTSDQMTSQICDERWYYSNIVFHPSHVVLGELEGYNKSTSAGQEYTCITSMASGARKGLRKKADNVPKYLQKFSALARLI